MDRRKVKVKAVKTWQLHEDTTTPSASSPQSVVKNPSDVAFVDDTSFIVCDSDLHCLHLFKRNSEKDCERKDGEEEEECGTNNVYTKDNGDNTCSMVNSKSIEISKSNGCSIKTSINDGLKFDEYDHSVLLHEQVWPNCIVMTEDGKVRLSDRKSQTVQTYDIATGALLSEWGKDGVGDKSLNPHGVAVTSRNETVVTDAKEHRVCVLNDQGHLLRSFGSEGDLLDQFRLPFYACVDSKDNILVSDNMNYCVKTFDTLGNFLNRIGTGHLFGKRKFQSPYGITYDTVHSEILVVDNDTNRIFTYDDKGTFLRYAVTQVECVSPCGLSIMGDQLVVTLSNPDTCNVKVFHLESH